MIEITGLNKSFDGFRALKDLDLHVRKGSIYGLVGTNGAGKTTLLKQITGIIRPDSGNLLIEDQPVYDNLSIKRRMGFIPDDLFFFSTYTLKESARFYRSIYPNWNEERYQEMVQLFSLDEKRRLSRFSKGMQKQAAFILTMCTEPDYLFLDEPIDGLDPIIRKLVWKFVVNDVAEREMTVLVSSHNLREMEGICDSIGILDHGEMKIERDLDELKSDIHKVQVAFAAPAAGTDGYDKYYEGLNILHRESRGTVDLLIIRSPRNLVEETLQKHDPLIFDLLPLTLEEIFIYELGGESIAENSIF